MIKRIFISFMIAIMTLSFAGCKKSYDEKNLPQYQEQKFEISALSGPHEMSEEAFKQYKDAGFNVFAFSNHNGLYDSDNLYYLGSNRTEKALELCKKVGLDAYVAYGNSWATREIEGEDYFGDTPFSKHNYYGEYMDIIKGIRIMDEPNKEKVEQLSQDILINDFKKVYSDKKYMINLIPETAITSRDYQSYTEMLEHFGNGILSKFENPYISVDCYLYSKSDSVGGNIINNYNQIAKCAKKYGAETTFILQATTGREFLDTLSEADMRQQAYLAIAFGADNLQYYSYTIPTEIEYDYCMLQKDNKTPSELYYHVKNINTEIQNFASAVLAYDWKQSIGVSGTEDQTFHVASIEYDANFEKVSITDSKNYVSATGTQDLVVSQFESKNHGEAFMFVNFGRNDGKVNTVNATFKGCGAVAIYGGEGYSGTPQIIKPDKEGKLAFELNYGEGVFVTPIK